MLVEGREAFAQGYRANVHCRNLLLDIGWQRENLRADHADATLATRPVERVIGDAIGNTVSLREHLDEFALDDPGPGLATFAQAGGRIVRSLRRAFEARHLRAASVRGRLEQEAAAAVRGAQSVLFVCKGNVCRSPFAEQLARTRALFPRVTSSGYHPVPDRPSPEAAVLAAA